MYLKKKCLCVNWIYVARRSSLSEAVVNMDMHIEFQNFGEFL
jgi:hypothetical protein